MKRAIVAASVACVALGAGTQVWAQEGISVFEGGGDDSSPIRIGDGAGDAKGPAEGGGLVIEGMNGSDPTAPPSWGAEATLKFVESGGVMFVPTKVAGKKAYFIFDTGAGLTTLTPEFAKKIGAAPGKDAPRMTTMTANGPRPTRLSVARSMKLANVSMGPFTFSTCAPCGGGTIEGAPVVGLLGRNVLSRIDFRIDDEAGLIKFRLKSGHKNQRRDVERWISYGFERASDEDHAVFVLENRAPRSLRDMKFDIECETYGAGPFTKAVTFGDVGARKKAKKKVKVVKSGMKTRAERRCTQPKVTLRSASW